MLLQLLDLLLKLLDVEDLILLCGYLEEVYRLARSLQVMAETGI